MDSSCPNTSQKREAAATYAEKELMCLSVPWKKTSNQMQFLQTRKTHYMITGWWLYLDVNTFMVRKEIILAALVRGARMTRYNVSFSHYIKYWHYFQRTF